MKLIIIATNAKYMKLNENNEKYQVYKKINKNILNI